MKKLVLVVLLTMLSGTAYAGKNKIRVMSETRIEHLFISGDHQLRSSFGVRFRTDMKDTYTVFLIPRIRYGTDLWNIGPELRIPTSRKYFPSKYIMLFKAQFFLPTDEFKKRANETDRPTSE